MARAKSGLHKEITAIFDGVPMPKTGALRDASDRRAPGRVGYVPLKPPAPAGQSVAASKPEPLDHSVPRQVVDKPFRDAAGGHAAVESARRGVLARLGNRLFSADADASPMRRKVTVISIPVLAVVLILVLMRDFGAPSRTSVFGVRRERQPAKSAALSEVKIDWKVPALYPTTARDPMKVVSESSDTLRLQAKDATELVVTGISVSEDKTYAIVGTEIVQVGERILGATITRIDIREGVVEFEMDGKTWTQRVQATEQ